MKSKRKNKTADGRARIEGNEIVIRLDIDSLKIIVEAGPYGDIMRVTNTKRFARDLVKELNDEEEDGTTSIHRAIDEAASKAFENGSENCEEIKFGSDERDYY